MQNIIKEVEGVLQKQFWVTSTLKCALWDVILYLFQITLYFHRTIKNYKHFISIKVYYNL